MTTELELVPIGEAATETKIKIDQLVILGKDTGIKFYCKIPDYLVARLETRDSISKLFSYDEESTAIPQLLCLKPRHCSAIVKDGTVKDHEFPFAICLTGYSAQTLKEVVNRSTYSFPNEMLRESDHPTIISEEETTKESRESDKQQFTYFVREIPVNTRQHSETLDSPDRFWTVYSKEASGAEIVSDIVIKTVDLFISRDDVDAIKNPSRFSDLPENLRPSFARRDFTKPVPKSLQGKTVDEINSTKRINYAKRHEIRRERLKEIALKVARNNPEECKSFAGWASGIFDLRDTLLVDFSNPQPSEASLEKNLKKWFRLTDEGPVLVKPRSSQQNLPVED